MGSVMVAVAISGPKRLAPSVSALTPGPVM
jgi:hypothetical protein